MATIGTKQHPAVLRVRSEARAMQLIAYCKQVGVQAIVGVEPDQHEDITDLDRALNPPEPLRAPAKVGRNEPCPCGSGLKAKKCCPELTA